MNNKYFMMLLLFLSILVFFPSLSGCSDDSTREQTPSSTRLHKAQVAGAFYPGDKDELKDKVAQFLKNVEAQKIEDKPFALISPHAGYSYSGQVAAWGYKQLIGHKFDTVIIIGSSHYYRFDGISVYSEGRFETPLGQVELDKELATQLINASGQIKFLPDMFLKEHSLEVQIPFLQYIMEKELKICPILLGNPALYNVLTEALTPLIKDRNVLLIASTDMSHYHPYKEAYEIDELTLREIENFDIEGLVKRINEFSSRGDCVLCGAGAVLAVMATAQKLGIQKATLLKYANSGDVTGDQSRVVGYSSFIMTTKVKTKEVKEEMLNESDQKTLLQIARETIEEYIRTGKTKNFEVKEEILTKEQGVFVTLNKHGNLRGCIGYIRPIAPLYEAVSKMAIAAAFQDPRFPPVREDELEDIEIEISVLSDLKKIADPSEIKVGTHGIYIVKGINSGLLLPQVATEYKWDRDEFLRHTCGKAGLPPGAWKEKDTQIYIFSAQIFHEEVASSK